DRAISKAKDNPLKPASTGGLSPAQASEVSSATVAGAEDGFHLSMMVAGILMIVGGVIAGIGLRNPSRETEYPAPGAAPAGECAHCPYLREVGADHEHEPEPEPVAGTA